MRIPVHNWWRRSERHHGALQRLNKLLRSISKAIARGGHVIVPAFAVERTSKWC